MARTRGRPKSNISDEERIERRAAVRRKATNKLRAKMRTEGKKRASAYLPLEEIAFLIELGEGSISEGLQVAVSTAIRIASVESKEVFK